MNVVGEPQTEVSLLAYELRRASGSIPLTSVSETPPALLKGLGKYELRPEVKKLYHLRPKVSASRVSVASRVASRG